MADEQVRIDVVINARAAIEEIQAMTNKSKSLEQVVAKFGQFLLSSSQKWGYPLKSLRKDFEALNKELLALNASGELKGGGIFGKKALKNPELNAEVFELTDVWLSAKESANGYRVSQAGVVTEIKHTTAEVQKLSVEIAKLQKPARNPLGQFAGGTDFTRQLNSMKTYSEKLNLVQTTIDNISKKTGASFRDVGASMEKAFPNLENTNLVATAVENLTNKTKGLGNAFKSTKQIASEVDVALAKMAGTSNLLKTAGFTPAENVQGIVTAMKQIKGETGASFNQIAAGMKRMGIESAYVDTALGKLKNNMLGFRHGIDVVRTALGTLTAVAIFQFLSAIGKAFTDASKNAQELEASIYRLRNAERILSNEGINISFQGMEDGIKRIKELLPIFSKEDITGLVGQLTISTKELGLTESQIIDLAESIAILNVNSSQNESLQQTGQKVVSTLLTNNAKGVADLGIKLGNAAIEAKAFELNILKAGESFADLTAHEKDLAKVAIVIQTGQDSMAGLNDYMNTNTARIQANKAAWNDLLTTVGQLFLPFIPAVTFFLKVIEDGFNVLKTFFSVFFIGATSASAMIQLFLDGQIKSFDDFKEKIKEVDEAAKKFIGRLFFPEGVPAGAPQWFKNFFGDALSSIDTPTADVNPFDGVAPEVEEDGNDIVGAVQETEDKIVDIMAEARQKRLDIDQEYRRKIEDANREHAQRLQDIAREAERKREDAMRDYQQKVEDINRDAAQAAADAQEDYRQRELDAEAEFRNRLRELRDRFLLDLEDALHERDARQVLRLIREYKLEKKNLEERRKLEQQEAKRNLQRKLQEIERERILKLEAARRELAEKQAEIDLWQEREAADARLALARKLADARLWHQREIAEYREYLKRKLQDLAAAIVKEYQLTAQGAQAIYALLQQYFGSGGLVGNLFEELNDQLSDIAGGISGNISGSSGFANSGLYGTGLANGGTFIATRPTRLWVGEKQPEAITATPLGSIGSGIGKVYGDTSALGSNSLNLRISLADGLVAEIIDSSLTNVASHLEKIGRER